MQCQAILPAVMHLQMPEMHAATPNGRALDTHHTFVFYSRYHTAIMQHGHDKQASSTLPC